MPYKVNGSKSSDEDVVRGFGVLLSETRDNLWETMSINLIYTRPNAT
jgi:hypothetical protein